MTTTYHVYPVLEPDPNYDLVPDRPAQRKRGMQCGRCGVKFDYGVSYGYHCGQYDCPIQMRGRS